MGLLDTIQEKLGYKATKEGTATGMAVSEAEDIFKAFIPEYLYKPPYGFPRKTNLPLLKLLAKNPYIFSVIKTITDEACNIEWEIGVKEKFSDDGVDYSEKINEITEFFNNPNKNGESFDTFLRMLIPAIYEVDAGVAVKVFTRAGKFDQLFVRDGATFLKNPDIYGYIGDRADFVKPMGEEQLTNETIRKQYDGILRNNAAYFQFGWTAGSMPVPFGKKEVVWFEMNPRYDSIYGRSPLEVLSDIVKTLVYGSRYNLSFYANNNLPEGVIQLLGAQEQDIEAFRQRFEAQFTGKNEFDETVKNFFKFPISSSEVKFTPFQILSKELEVLSQQEWFTKVVWMCFGVTADEMGFTETSNKTNGEEQVKASKRKALQPLLQNISNNLNMQVMPEFFDESFEETVSFREIPLEFRFKLVDKEEEAHKLNILEQKIRMGVMTPDMAAIELGIDIDELNKSREEHLDKDVREQEAMNNVDNSSNQSNSDVKKEDSSVEEKSQANPQKEKEFLSVIDEIDGFVDDVSKTFLKDVEKVY